MLHGLGFRYRMWIMYTSVFIICLQRTLLNKSGEGECERGQERQHFAFHSVTTAATLSEHRRSVWTGIQLGPASKAMITTGSPCLSRKPILWLLPPSPPHPHEQDLHTEASNLNMLLSKPSSQRTG